MNGIPLARIDSRFPVTPSEWLEDIADMACLSDSHPYPSYWCALPAGEWVIGGWNEEQTHASLTLPAYWIARFPITVAQYSIFTNTGYTPDAEMWWTQAGWTWRIQDKRQPHPWKWDDPDLTNPDQPVIGITWYEAVAFARWMAQQCADVLPQGYTLRLPTEAEWEIAVAYDAHNQRQRYAWGNDAPTRERVVYNGTGTRTTASVGMRPSGAATCGAEDMAGNVWEWMCSMYTTYPHQSATVVEDFAAEDKEVPVRGGCWSSSASFIQNSVRDWHRPDYYDQTTGFRLVMAPV